MYVDGKMFALQKKLVGCVFMLVASAFASSVSCKEEKAQLKFITLEQEASKTGHVLTGDFLIKKVHDSEWKIFYGFEDNNHCNRVFVGDKLAALKGRVVESINVWLAPLRDKQGIIELTSITLQEKETQSLLPYDQADNTELAGEELRYKATINSNDAHLSIVFLCEEGRSFARVGDSKPEIHMFQSLGNYEATTIHHEMGHAFGLGDTYVDNSIISNSLKRFNKSTGGDKNTVGMQPLAVMNMHRDYGVGLSSDGKLQLTLDDIAGIKWLYHYYVEKNVVGCDCPYDYVYEEETGGCRPQYPLIFAAKQGFDLDYKHFQEHLPNMNATDGFIAAMRQQDNLGNTILHYYAANLAHRGHLYPFLYNEALHNDKSILNIENKLGKTAVSIYASDNPVNLLYSSAGLDEAKRKHQEEVSKVCEPLAFRMAALDANVDRVKKSLASGNVDVNKQDHNGSTVLHGLAYNFTFERSDKYVPIFALLLKHKNIDLRIKDYYGISAFAILSESRDEEKLTECLQSLVPSYAVNAALDYLNSIYYFPDYFNVTTPSPEESDPNTGQNSPPPEDMHDGDTVGLPEDPLYTKAWCKVVENFYNTRDR